MNIAIKCSYNTADCFIIEIKILSVFIMQKWIVLKIKEKCCLLKRLNETINHESILKASISCWSLNWHKCLQKLRAFYIFSTCTNKKKYI